MRQPRHLHKLYEISDNKIRYALFSLSNVGHQRRTYSEISNRGVGRGRVGQSLPLKKKILIVTPVRAGR